MDFRPRSIFLSSTVDDMQEERDAITEVVNSIRNQQVSRCEYFSARTKSPKEVCLNESRNCDIFIGIYKDRYGFIPEEDNPDGISVTEMEYNEARKQDRIICIFISAESEKKDDKLSKFLNRIKNFSKGHYVKKFHDINELKYLVLHSLVFNILNSSPDSDIENLETLVPDQATYQKTVLKEFEHQILRGIAQRNVLVKYKLSDIFVPPELVKYSDVEKSDEDKDSEYSQKVIPIQQMSWTELNEIIKSKQPDVVTTGIDIYEQLKDYRPLVLLGEPGSGKTTLLKYFCSDILVNTPTIPFYVQIKDFVQQMKKNNNESVITYLQNKYPDIEKLQTKFILAQLETGSTVIVFDGLDEVWDVADRAKINEILERFCASWASNNKVIISSRIAGYKQNPLAGNIELLKIGYFNSTKIIEFVRKWVNIIEENSGEQETSVQSMTAGDLIQEISSSTELEKLAKNPLLLSIICLVYTKNLSFPKNKFLLYSLLVETLLSSWDRIKGMDTGKYNIRDFTELLKEIAYWMFTNNKTEITKNELFELIKNQLVKIGFEHVNNNEVDSIISHFEERSGLLISYGIGNYNFYHLSIQEYFIAIKIADQKDVQTLINYFKGGLHNPKNHEIVLFLTGKISEDRQVSSAFLDQILNADTKYEDVLFTNFILVSECLTNGAYITQSFEDKLFQKLDSLWDEQRNYDDEFFYTIEGLVSSPYEKKLNELWRKKCNAYWTTYSENPLSRDFLSLPENLDYLKSFIQHIRTKRDTGKGINIVDVNQIIQVIPSSMFDEFIYLVDSTDDIRDKIHEITIFHLANRCADDKELQDWYFDKIPTLKSAQLIYYMFHYAGIVDINRAKLELEKIIKTHQDSKVVTILEKLYCKIDSPRLEEQNKQLEEWLEHLPSAIILENLLLENFHYFIYHDEYNAEYVNRMIKLLGKFPDDYIMPTLRIIIGLDNILDNFSESRNTIDNLLNNPENNYTKWNQYYIGLRIKLHGKNESEKKNIMNLIRDPKLNPIIGRYFHEILIHEFQNDLDVIQFNTTLINNVEFCSNALIFMIRNNYVNEIKKSVNTLLNLLKDTSYSNHRIQILAILRSAVRAGIA